jgi:DnaA family protein
MSKESPQQLLLGFQLDEAATLESFQAAAADRQLIQHLHNRVIDSSEPLTIIWGPAGTGKTHLLQALCHELTCAGGTPIYLPLSRTEQVAPEMLEGLEDLDLVCLDDIDAVAGESAWEQALFGFYNRAAISEVRLVVSASMPPGKLQIQLPDLHSRLQSGVVFQLHELSDTEKAELLSQRARALGIELSKSVIDYVLQRHDRQVVALVQFLQELDRLSLEQKRPITIPLVRQLMDW